MAWVIKDDLPYQEDFPELEPLERTLSNTWKSDGIDLPYRDNFPYIITRFDNAPLNMWLLIDDVELPLKRTFPRLHKFTDAPLAIWIIENGELPKKRVFPRMYKFTDVPYAIWYMDEDNKIPNKYVFPPMYFLEDLRMKYDFKKIKVILNEHKEKVVLDDYKQKVIMKDLTYTNVGCAMDELIWEKSDLEAEIAEFEYLIKTIPVEKTLREYARMYNAITNGNLDYTRRNYFITADKMWDRGWMFFPADGKATTYYQNYTFNNYRGVPYWVIEISPILSQNNIYTPSQLEIYKERFRDICESEDATIEDILEEDIYNIIGHIYEGIPERDKNGLTEIDRQLEPIKENHMILMEYEDCQRRLPELERAIQNFEEEHKYVTAHAELCEKIMI